MTDSATDDATDEATEIHCIVFDRGTEESRRVDAADLAAELENDDVFAWVDVHGPAISVLNEFAAGLGLTITPENKFGTREILPRLTEADDHGSFYLYEVLHPERHLEVSRGLTPIETVRLVVVLSSRDLLDGILQSQQTAAANRTSEIARVLTIISGVLLPITVVAGIYGMNFKEMPELLHPYGYYGALGLMALIATGQLLLFRRLGWIGHPKTLR